MWFGFVRHYLSNDFASDQLPSLIWDQLRRSCFETLKKCMYAREHRNGALFGHMHARDQEMALARKLGLSAHRCEQHWLGADRLHSLSWVGRSHVHAPPVINQHVVPHHQRRAYELFAGKARPTPLILQFVETVLTVRPIPVELCCFPRDGRP